VAHEIYQDRRMFYAGATPWHGLGTPLPANAPWEQVAALFYAVIERPIFAPGIPTPLPDVKALVAGDDGRYLATVGADYCVVQASEVAEAIVTAGRGNEAIFHTGGLLGDNGARGWLLGELPSAAVQVPGDDSPIKAYFLGSFGHDGKTPVTLINCATRVVCKNTLGMAMGERGGFRSTIRHTSGAADRVASAAQAFTALRQSSQRLAAWGALAGQTVLDSTAIAAAIDSLIPLPEGAKESAKDAVNDQRTTLINLLSRSSTVPDAHRRTAWGLLQATTEYAEHLSPLRLAKSSATTDTQRRLEWTMELAERKIHGTLTDRSANALECVLAVSGLPHPSVMPLAA
jgi:phage/plasmid-like protein (TIGR03299 family)